jgi:hypothetical protein
LDNAALQQGPVLAIRYKSLISLRFILFW